MVQWSDLPIELRYRIFQYVFIGTTISYSERRHATRYDTNSESLALQLVSRSFARRGDVIGAMLSTAALGLRTGLDLDLISANKRYHHGLLARLCTITITRSVTWLNQLPLSRLQALMPRLSSIHAQAFRDHHPLCQVFPEIFIANDSATAPLIDILKKQQSDDGLVHMISSNASRGSSYGAQQTFELSSSGEAVDLELWKFAVESALMNTSPYLMKARNCATWLATLLTDVESARDKPEIKLSWHLSVGVETFMGSRRECPWYFLEEVSFSTNDMRIRCLLGDTEVLLPQKFSPKLAAFGRSFGPPVFARSFDSNH